MSRYADDATISGSIVVTGSATFNDQSKDVDFIVESDDNTHMLFIDAGNDRVGVGTSAPDYTLDVAGDIGVDQYIYHNGDADTLISFTDDKIVFKAGNLALVTLEKKGSAPHEVTINDGANNVDFVVKGNGSNAGNPGMNFDASTNRLGINGVGSPSYELDVAGDIGLSEYIYHKGDDDTFIRFQDDDITIKAGAVNCISFTSASQCQLICNDSGDDLDFIVRSPSQNLALYLNAGNEVFHINHGETGFKTKIHSTNGEAITVNNDGVILNEDGSAENDFRIESDGEDEALFLDSSTNTFYINKGATAFTTVIKSTNEEAIRVGASGVILNQYGHASNDFRVESDNNAHMLFVDAGNDKVGIGTDAPGVALEVEAAAGDIFKMENTTAYGITYGQLVKENLTLTDGGSPIDTTLNLPAASMITDVLIAIKTLAVGDASTIDNVALTYGGQTSNIKGSSFSNISMIASAGLVAVGTQYVLGNTDQSYPAGRATILLGGTADIKLAYTDTNLTTEPIVDVVVFYKKFDTS